MQDSPTVGTAEFSLDIMISGIRRIASPTTFGGRQGVSSRVGYSKPTRTSRAANHSLRIGAEGGLAQFPIIS